MLSALILVLSILASAAMTAEVKPVEEHWPNGALKLHREMAEDLRGRVVANGVETLYAADGTKQSETTYHLGVKEGPWREFFGNGKVRIEGNFRRGQKEGVETRYSESGEKSAEINFHDGLLEGKRFDWNGRQKTY